jgi:hypothetical protein
MVWKVLAAVFCVGICLGLATADDFKGKVKNVDAKKKSITVDVDGKAMTFMVTDDTKFTSGKTDLADGLKAKILKPGAMVTVKTPEGSMEMATEVQVKGAKKKPAD